MTENIDDVIERIRARSLPGAQKKASRRLHSFLRPLGAFAGRHRKGMTVAFLFVAAVAALAGAAGWLLVAEAVQKRQHYPERNVLYRAVNITYVAGKAESRNARDIDFESVYKVFEGTVESKVGTYLFEAVRETRDEVETFSLDNSQKIRMVSAIKKPELVQAGVSLSGAVTFREEIAEAILPDGKSKRKYMLYKFIPERSSREVEIVLTEDETGVKHLENRTEDLRFGPHGWLWGKEYREGTQLCEYACLPRDSTLVAGLTGDIKTLDDQKSSDPAVRIGLINDALRLDALMPVLPIYVTYEDGIFDLFPQGSTMYLGKPRVPWSRRLKNRFLLTTSDSLVIRIGNHWDLWPGRWPLVSSVAFGGGKNVVYPFNKYNNGGYTLRDACGDIARINIRDFILKYGQDVVYEYYFDLDGDGRIDTQSECIGKVLCAASNDEQVDLEKEVGAGQAKKDITLTLSFSFMAPDADLKKGMEYFYLCAWIESCMPDQIHRGFGKHSYIGSIKRQRGDIMLFRDLNANGEINIRNMSRVLSQESALVAKHDILNALEKAKRPYARRVARLFGIAEEAGGRRPETSW